MAVKNGYRVFDCDGHVVEDDAELFEYLESPFKGHTELLTEPLFPPMDRVHRMARAVLDTHIEETQGKKNGGPKIGIEISKEPWADKWLKVLDAGGIEETVLYPTYGLGFGFVWEPEWAVGLAKAYNSWFYDRYFKINSRLHGMALLPLQSPAEAVEELRRAVTKLGMVGGILPGAGLKRPLGDQFYFPIYQAAQELEVPLAVHAGAAQGMGLDIFERSMEARTLSHSFGQIIQLTSLMFSGVFDLFPRLRMAFLEGGVAWVPFLLERMQRAYKLWRVQAPELKREPREHLTSGRIFFHAELEDPFLSSLASTLGDQCLMYASDFPHEPAKEVLHDLREFQERTDLAEELKRRYLGENARRLYKL